MRKAAAAAILALLLPGCSRHRLNEVSLLKYEREDSAAEVAGKSFVNVVPWTVLGAGYAFLALCAAAPEAMVAAVGEFTSR